MSLLISTPAVDSFAVPYSGLSSENLIRWAKQEFGDQLAVSTSFGIQSSVTLKLVTDVMPEIPVIWVDTGYLHEETHRYADQLTSQLNLNLHVYRSPISPIEMEARFGKLWDSDEVADLNLYDQIRKVEPMQRALDDLDVRGWISGLRSSQTQYRQKLPPIKRSGSRYRIYPILEWTNRDTYQFMQRHDLPQHPLFEQGYVTVGDQHSSRPFRLDDTDERDTRFRGLNQECGLHL